MRPGPRLNSARVTNWIGSLDMHFGMMLSWHSWPYTGVLTSESSEKLVNWLAEHGYDKPKKDVEDIHVRARAREARMREYSNKLPEKTLAALEESRMGLTRRLKAFTETVSDKTRDGGGAGVSAALGTRGRLGPEGQSGESDYQQSAGRSKREGSGGGGGEGGDG